MTTCEPIQFFRISHLRPSRCGHKMQLHGGFEVGNHNQSLALDLLAHSRHSALAATVALVAGYCECLRKITKIDVDHYGQDSVLKMSARDDIGDNKIPIAIALKRSVDWYEYADSIFTLLE